MLCNALLQNSFVGLARSRVDTKGKRVRWRNGGFMVPMTGRVPVNSQEGEWERHGGGQPWGIPECLVKIADLSWWLAWTCSWPGSVLNKSLWLMITTFSRSCPDLGQPFLASSCKKSVFASVSCAVGAVKWKLSIDNLPLTTFKTIDALRQCRWAPKTCGTDVRRQINSMSRLLVGEDDGVIFPLQRLTTCRQGSTLLLFRVDVQNSILSHFLLFRSAARRCLVWWPCKRHNAPRLLFWWGKKSSTSGLASRNRFKSRLGGGPASGLHRPGTTLRLQEVLKLKHPLSTNRLSSETFSSLHPLRKRWHSSIGKPLEKFCWV